MNKQLITSILLLTTYWVNYLSSSGQLGENLMNLRSIFPFPYMPAGRTFGIARSAIYLMLAVWLIWSWSDQGKKSELNDKILPRFWVSSVLNIIRIYCTAREWYAFSVIIIASLMGILWKILSLIMEQKASYVLTIPFGLYAGRVTMATTIVGISQLVFILINNEWPLTNRWTILVICFGTGIAGYLFRKYRNRAQLLITIVALAGVGASLIG